MKSIKLSICIPTYNRAPFLQDCLERCLQDFVFDFSIEIVVSDNHSTDETEAVVHSFIERGAPIRYVKGDANTGMIPNMNSALRLGRGDYLTYLADDDRLLADNLAKVVNYLDENEHILACYAPWQISDGHNEDDKKHFYRLDADKVFKRRSFAETFNLLMQRHIFPEIGVYRSAAFRAAWTPRSYCHYCFPILAHLLDQGDVAFRQEPFYRQITRSAVGDRQQGGVHLAMTDWDSYRGGLEYFLYFGMKRGRIGTTPEDRATMEYLCRKFTIERMAVAIRLLIARDQYLKAYELMTRMDYAGHGAHPQILAIKDNLALAAAIQTLAFQVGATAGVRRLILSGFTDTKVLRERLQRVGIPQRVDILDEPEDHAEDMLNRTAILVPSGDLRERFVDLGYLPNLVFSQEDLVQTILI